MSKKEKANNTKSVNLPRTAFPMKANLQVREIEFMDFWKKEEIYRKLISKNKNNKRFILHDGPPYANGNIHLGHALNKILKDMVVKYKACDGHYTPFIPGWDCHGLPIEHQLMKKLKTNKRKINREDFRKKAYEFAEKYFVIQREEFVRLGILADWDNPYLTMTKDYEYGIISTFNKLLKNEYIYRSKKPVFWCICCETALADAEVEYENHISPSIYVRFPLIEGQKFGETVVNKQTPVSMLIWTTTPWTLPANVAVAVEPEKAYGLYKTGNSELYIAAADPELEKEYPKLGIQIDKPKSVIQGSDLLGLKVMHPLLNRESVIVGSGFVQMDTGVGAIHIAPGHGLEDYQVGLENGLPVISPVDEMGFFTEEAGICVGENIFNANGKITKELGDRKLLLSEDKIEHSYPHCWRCKNPVIYRATKQWFLSINHRELRQKMLDSIKKVKWIPGYGENRILGMVESRPDWCLSRQRYWGTPIPIIYCEDCQAPVIDDGIIKRIEDIFKEGGSEAYYQTSVKEIIGDNFACRSCDGSSFKKEEDILDVWFDSGVSHEAVMENPRFNLGWPATMYLEGSDQHRGWFQTSLITAVALKARAPYESVLTHGFTVDGQGRKMSKSQGNVIAPQAVIKDYGADILRLWVAASDYREDVRVSQDIIRGLVDLYRKIRNTFRFILGNTYDYNASEHKKNMDPEHGYPNFLEIDKYILNRLQKLLKVVNDAYESNEFHKVVFYFNQFCSSELSSFYFDIIKDRLYTFSSFSKERHYAQTVLWELFENLSCLIAPILSFTSEEVWKFARDEHKDWESVESVFLAPFPKVKDFLLSDDLETNWRELLKVREKVNAVLENFRIQKKIGSSLEAWVRLFPAGEEEYGLLERFKDQLDTIFIVSRVSVEAPGKGSELSVEIEKASVEKCSRCWRYTGDQSKIGDELICSRCLAHIEENEKGL
ncbi:MAG: isoleucine--tRNA ligase [bacterium]